jgi:omega-amidase
MKDLVITLIQTELHWENPVENRKMFSQKIDAVEKTDLIILPEMFGTGFTMNAAHVAEDMQGPTVNWMRERAAEKSACICGSLVIKEKNQYYNRLIWMRADGSCETYDKRHLFRYANEQDHYQSGSHKLIVELNGWKICPLVCYDLRFPVWSRNTWEQKSGDLTAAYDLLIYVANWPERRNYPWKTLLAARAIENQAYVAGVNRVGNDNQQVSHSGDSALLNFKGEILSHFPAGKSAVETLTLSSQELFEFRKSFPVGMDADKFKLH